MCNVVKKSPNIRWLYREDISERERELPTSKNKPRGYSSSVSAVHQKSNVVHHDNKKKSIDMKSDIGSVDQPSLKHDVEETDKKVIESKRMTWHLTGDGQDEINDEDRIDSITTFPKAQNSSSIEQRCDNSDWPSPRL